MKARNALPKFSLKALPKIGFEPSNILAFVEGIVLNNFYNNNTTTKQSGLKDRLKTKTKTNNKYKCK